MLFFRRVVLLAVGWSLFVGGCAGTVQEGREQLDAKRACCDSMSQFKYEALPADGAAEFSLNNESPVFNFETGKSYFKSYALPESSQGRMLRIAHRPGQLGMIGPPEHNPAYCPRVAFLDERFEQVSESTNFPQWVPTLLEGGHFENAVLIPEKAKYVVLHTNPRVYGVHAATRASTGGGYMVGNTAVITPGGKGISHPCGPTANGVSVSLGNAYGCPGLGPDGRKSNHGDREIDPKNGVVYKCVSGIWMPQ